MIAANAELDFETPEKTSLKGHLSTSERGDDSIAIGEDHKFPMLESASDKGHKAEAKRQMSLTTLFANAIPSPHATSLPLLPLRLVCQACGYRTCTSIERGQDGHVAAVVKELSCSACRGRFMQIDWRWKGDR